MDSHTRTHLVEEQSSEADPKLGGDDSQAPLGPAVLGVVVLDGGSALAVLGPLETLLPAALQGRVL